MGVSKFRGWRSYSWPLIPCFFLLTAGCGGGGGGGGGALSSSGGAVQVSMAAAPGFPAGTAFTTSPAAVEEAAKPVSPAFDNVWAKIWKVALLPAKEGEGPDPNGEMIASNDGPEHDGEFVFAFIEPVEINLLDLPPGRKLARFLNKFLDVPAGTYGKIRVYYTELWGERVPDGRIDFHPTANSHFDVHFVNRDLVIPVAPDVDGGIRLYDVTIEFVGLKIVENKNKVLMRPQVFATVVEAVEYVISGIADNVDKTLGTFDVSTAGGSFHVEYDDETFWSFHDSSRSIDVKSGQGISALDNTAIVDVFGLFSTSGNLLADDIHILFPLTITDNVISGDATSGWIDDTFTDTFTLDIALDNVVYPKPNRDSAVYDNAVSPFNPLDQSFIVQGARVTARGYPADAPTGGVEAYWISIGP